MPGATSAVMEMCVDNPREDFADLFDTHPSIDKRVAAIVKFAGGHDPGPIALPEAPHEDDAQREDQNEPSPQPTAAPRGPWGQSPAPGGSRSCLRNPRSSSVAARRPAQPPTNPALRGRPRQD